MPVSTKLFYIYKNIQMVILTILVSPVLIWSNEKSFGNEVIFRRNYLYI